MKITRVAILLIFGIALVALTVVSFANSTRCDIQPVIGKKWLATGAATRITGSTIHFLGKDNRVYAISSEHSSVIAANDQTMDLEDIHVGEKIRVYGTVIGPCSVRADRIRLYRSPAQSSSPAGGKGPQQEVKIVIEKEPLAEEAVPANVPDWKSSGLITDIDYTGRKVSIMTSNGGFTVNAGSALIVNGSTRIGFARLNIGDKVDIIGNLVGVADIAAQKIEVMRTRSMAENAVPTLPVSIIGVILSIDYASSTLRMASGASGFVVSIDNNTQIQHQMDRMAFINLKPGMRIKMSGYGSLISGYAASHIQVISVSP